MEKIAIGADHAGFEYKELLKKWLDAKGYTTKDFGTYTADSADYPDFAHPVATAVEKKEFDLGLLVCGSANGVAITANKHQGIRAAICWKEERYISKEDAEKILDKFLHTAFEGGRHATRVGKINC
jgi:ribose 5-phosphate isomerase B